MKQRRIILIFQLIILYSLINTAGFAQKPCPSPNGGSNKPRPPGIISPVSASTLLVQAMDPNEMIGPPGQPDNKWMSVNDRLAYTILCENAKTAGAPAKYIYISTPVEPKQDPTTLQLGSFGFNNQQFNIPQGTSSYYQRLDCRDSMGLYVDVVAGYNQISNEVFWQFQSIDAVTLLPTDDPMKGILFVQDSAQPNYGHGYVTFSMKPRPDAVTLDTIGARAVIVFDDNDTIPTNIYTNTIDARPPSSHMNAIGGSTSNPITLSWTGADDANGCGIDFYTVYVSNDQVNYSILFPRMRRTDTSFVLSPSSSVYCFFVLATDRVGNTELLQPGVPVCTSIDVPLPVTWLYFNGINQGTNNLLKWATGSEQNTREFIVERSLDGINFSAVGTVPAAGNSSDTKTYSYTDVHIDRLNSSVMFYRLKQTDINRNFKYSNIIRLNYNRKGTGPSIVYPNPTNGSINILLDDNNMIGTEAILTDVNGKIIKTLKIVATNQSIDLSAMVNGIYLLRLNNNETLKVVKQ